jgi:hypothetical protein
VILLDLKKVFAFEDLSCDLLGIEIGEVEKPDKDALGAAPTPWLFDITRVGLANIIPRQFGENCHNCRIAERHKCRVIIKIGDEMGFDVTRQEQLCFEAFTPLMVDLRISFGLPRQIWVVGGFLVA